MKRQRPNEIKQISSNIADEGVSYDLCECQIP